MEENSPSKIKVRTGMMVGKATIYGTDWCGFTTKQKKAFDDKGIEYDYINCDTNPEQCAGIQGYPVVTNSPADGQGWEGFKAL
jgi:hypothetical protein